MGHYMHSVYTAMGGNPDAAVNDDGSVYDDARFNVNDERERPTQLILAELGKDNEGREILTSFANAPELVELDQNLNGVSDVDEVERRVTGTSLLAAEVLGAVDFGANVSAAEVQMSSDQSYNQNVDDGVSAGKGVLGATPIGKLPLAGTVMDLVATRSPKQPTSTTAVNTTRNSARSSAWKGPLTPTSYGMQSGGTYPTTPTAWTAVRTSTISRKNNNAPTTTGTTTVPGVVSSTHAWPKPNRPTAPPSATPRSLEPFER